MSINANGLASVMVIALADIEDSSQGIEAMTSTLSSYFTENLEVLGNYTGSVSGSPDPLSGNYPLKFKASPNLAQATSIKAFMASLAGPDPIGFMAAIGSDMLGSTVGATGTIITTAVIVLPTFSVDPDVLKAKKSVLDCWKVIGESLCEGFLSLTFPPAATTSSGGGSGTTTLLSVS
jgi:hypothetical protein